MGIADFQIPEFNIWGLTTWTLLCSAWLGLELTDILLYHSFYQITETKPSNSYRSTAGTSWYHAARRLATGDWRLATYIHEIRTVLGRSREGSSIPQYSM